MKRFTIFGLALPLEGLKSPMEIRSAKRRATLPGARHSCAYQRRAMSIVPAIAWVCLTLAGVARGSLWYAYDGKDVDDPEGIVQRIVRPGDGWNTVHPAAFAGIMIDVSWGEIEPDSEHYNFDNIDRQLTSLATKGMSGMVKLRDKYYQKPDKNGSLEHSEYIKCVPADLDGTGNITATNTGPGGAFPIRLGIAAWGRDETYRFIVQHKDSVGRPVHIYVAKRWNLTVKERWQKMLMAAGVSSGFGRHANLRKIASTESAVSVGDYGILRKYLQYPETTLTAGYTEIIREVASIMRSSFPTSVDIEYELNWIPAAMRDGSFQRAVVLGVVGATAPGFRENRPVVGLLVEDWSDRTSYKTEVYSLFELYKIGETPLGVQISGDTKTEYKKGFWGTPGPDTFRNMLATADSIGGGNKVNDLVFKMYDKDFFEPLVTYLVSHKKDGAARKDGDRTGFGFLPR